LATHLVTEATKLKQLHHVMHSRTVLQEAFASLRMYVFARKLILQTSDGHWQPSML
jgi:hypothetical protein